MTAVIMEAMEEGTKAADEQLHPAIRPPNAGKPLLPPKPKIFPAPRTHKISTGTQVNFLKRSVRAQSLAKTGLCAGKPESAGNEDVPNSSNNCATSVPLRNTTSHPPFLGADHPKGSSEAPKTIIIKKQEKVYIQKTEVRKTSHTLIVKPQIAPKPILRNNPHHHHNKNSRATQTVSFVSRAVVEDGGGGGGSSTSNVNNKCSASNSRRGILKSNNITRSNSIPVRKSTGANYSNSNNHEYDFQVWCEKRRNKLMQYETVRSNNSRNLKLNNNNNNALPRTPVVFTGWKKSRSFPVFHNTNFISSNNSPFVGSRPCVKLKGESVREPFVKSRPLSDLNHRSKSQDFIILSHRNKTAEHSSSSAAPVPPPRLKRKSLTVLTPTNSVETPPATNVHVPLIVKSSPIYAKVNKSRKWAQNKRSIRKLHRNNNTYNNENIEKTSLLAEVPLICEEENSVSEQQVLSAYNEDSEHNSRDIFSDELMDEVKELGSCKDMAVKLKERSSFSSEPDVRKTEVGTSQDEPGVGHKDEMMAILPPSKSSLFDDNLVEMKELLLLEDDFQDIPLTCTEEAIANNNNNNNNVSDCGGAEVSEILTPALVNNKSFLFTLMTVPMDNSEGSEGGDEGESKGDDGSVLIDEDKGENSKPDEERCSNGSDDKSNEVEEEEASCNGDEAPKLQPLLTNLAPPKNGQKMLSPVSEENPWQVTTSSDEAHSPDVKEERQCELLTPQKQQGGKDDEAGDATNSKESTNSIGDDPQNSDTQPLIAAETKEKTKSKSSLLDLVDMEIQKVQHLLADIAGGGSESKNNKKKKKPQVSLSLPIDVPNKSVLLRKSSVPNLFCSSNEFQLANKKEVADPQLMRRSWANKSTSSVGSTTSSSSLGSSSQSKTPGPAPQHSKARRMSDFTNWFWVDEGETSTGAIGDNEHSPLHSSNEDIVFTETDSGRPFFRRRRTVAEFFGKARKTSVMASFANASAIWKNGRRRLSTTNPAELPKIEVVYADNASSSGSNMEKRLSFDEDEEEEPDMVAMRKKAEAERLEKIMSELSPKSRKAFYVVREILSSEQTFVEVLQLITVEFPKSLRRYAKRHKLKQGVISEQDLDFILGGLPILKGVNEDLLQDLDERVSGWGEGSKIADIFVKKGAFLKHYTNYIKDFEKISRFFDKSCEKNSHFALAVRTFEERKICHNLGLRPYMLKPVQRMPQYSLLLEDYLRNIDEEHVDWEDTHKAITIVRSVAEHANETIRIQAAWEQRILLQQRLPGVDILGENVSHLVRQGELLKVGRKELQPRYFALMNDCLLCMTYLNTSHVNSSLKDLKLKYKLSLARMKVLVATNQEHQHEFNIISVARSFSVVAKSSRERDDWMETMTQTINEFNRRRPSFHPSIDCVNKGHQLGKQAPIWIQDSRVSMCHGCTTEFSLVFRRHHCRACGNVVCRHCSGNEAPLKYRDDEPCRVCDPCYEVLLNEFDASYEDKESKGYCQTRQKFKKVNIGVAPVKKSTKSKRHVRFPSRVDQTANSIPKLSGHLQWREKKVWRRSWFVLAGCVLYVFAASEDVAALKTLPILGYTVEAGGAEEDSDNALSFQLKHKGRGAILFQADDSNLAEKWIEALNEATYLPNQYTNYTNFFQQPQQGFGMPGMNEQYASVVPNPGIRGGASPPMMAVPSQHGDMPAQFHHAHHPQNSLPMPMMVQPRASQGNFPFNGALKLLSQGPYSMDGGSGMNNGMSMNGGQGWQ